VLIGGGGHDIFVFTSGFDVPSASSPAHPDIIKDFVQGEDLIDLSNLYSGSFAGPAHHLVDSFSGVANEVMVAVHSGSTSVLADLNGDKIADFEVQLSNPIHLTASDFLF